MENLNCKYETLKNWLAAHAPLALAFSGGVDSSLLMAACREAGVDYLAVTVESVFQSESERADARIQAEKGPWLRIPLDVLSVEGVRANPSDRCYLCKRAIFKSIFAHADGRTVIDGTNYDDLGDFRPGIRALRELGVLSPLMELGWTKPEIRAISRILGLSTADKPAMSCLATRIPMGECIETGKLRAIDIAEIALKNMGFEQVRVRAHGEIARIELDRSMLVHAAEHASEIVKAIKAAGFKRAALDLDGYNRGSMNERKVKGR